MNQADKHLTMLGHRGKDIVTGFKGTITSLSFDLYGCIQVCLTPKMDKDGEAKLSKWCDRNRVKIYGKIVMPMPDFNAGYVAEGGKGPAEKPGPQL